MSIEILIASNSALTFDASATPSIIFQILVLDFQSLVNLY